MKPTLYLIRGVPGCGKSTLARSLQDNGLVIGVFEADQYFEHPDGQYNFDASQLGVAHKICQKNTLDYLLNTYDGLYDIKYFGDPNVCVYCGKPRECLDHVPALSLLAKIGTKILRESGIELMKVPSCNSCNTRLSDRKLLTIGERLLHLYDYYNNLLRKKVIWSEEEINELSGNLKRLVRSSQNKIDTDILSRLKGIESNLLDKRKTEK